MRRKAWIAAPVAALAAAAAIASSGAQTDAPRPPQAPVLGCASRISGASVTYAGRTRDWPFVVRPGDRVIGPVAFSGLAATDWDSYVERDQWLKSIAMVRAGARVTLEVPEEQRAWLKLTYGHGRGDGSAVTLKACRIFRSAKAQRRECRIRPYTACRRNRTAFSGGFEIDYARAPLQGRCAELIVWVVGREEPLRRRLVPRAGGDCVNAR